MISVMRGMGHICPCLKTERNWARGVAFTCNHRKGRVFCSVCEVRYNDPDDLVDEDQWVFCPQCCVMSHASCLRARECICGFKLKKKHIVIVDSVH